MSLEPTQTICVNQGLAVDLWFTDHCVGPGDNLGMKAEHVGTCWKITVSTLPVSLVVFVTQVQRGDRGASQPEARFRRGRWSTRGSRGLLETWRQHGLSTSLTVIVPREPQRCLHP